MKRLSFAVLLNSLIAFSQSSTISLINHPKVIADFGGEGAIYYYKDILIKDNSKSRQSFPPFPEKSAFPMQSSYWRVGHTKAMHHNYPLQSNSAFFIIGDDINSVEWFKRNMSRLMKINAFGIVVNVKSKQNLESLRRINKQIPLYPNPDAEGRLSQTLGVSTYPILVVPNFLGENIDEIITQMKHR